MRLSKFENFSVSVMKNDPDEVVKIGKYIRSNISSLNHRLITDKSVVHVNKIIDKIMGNNFEFSYAELSALYELRDIIDSELKEYNEIEDYFLDWLDSKKWGISKAVAPGCYIFHVHGDYKDYSDFFAEMDSISKRKSLNIRINTISHDRFLALSVKINKK